jgi:hypothetical protein
MPQAPAVEAAAVPVDSVAVVALAAAAVSVAVLASAEADVSVVAAVSELVVSPWLQATARNMANRSGAVRFIVEASAVRV